MISQLSPITQAVRFRKIKSHKSNSSGNIGTDLVRNDPVIVELAAKYSVTPTQVRLTSKRFTIMLNGHQIILAWHLSRNVVVIPRSTDEERQKENHNVRAALVTPDFGR